MASTQISRIQVRRGLQENLPNLAAGELGWAVDSRRLFIGNGPTEEGAPVEGVTEILTELIDLDINYSTFYPNGSFTLAAEQINPTLSSLTIDSTVVGAVIEYTMIRDIDGTEHLRKGTLKVGHLGSNYTYEDTFQESANIGVVLGYDYMNGSYSAMTYMSANIGGGNATAFSYQITSQI